MIDINKYIISLEKVDLTKILRNWTWLTGDKSVVALTKAGDAILKDTDNGLYFLDIGAGEMQFISKDYLDFLDEKLRENKIDELLLPKLVDLLEYKNIKLKTMQVYSYTMLPILGGMYDEKNMFPLNLYEHYDLCGEIHYQLKDLQEGTIVKITFED